MHCIQNVVKTGFGIKVWVLLQNHNGQLQNKKKKQHYNVHIFNSLLTLIAAYTYDSYYI